jgi:hypothetical protein
VALKPCRECGKEVSTEAKQCPHCGVGHPTTKSVSSAGCAIGCLGVIVLAILIGVLSQGGNQGSQTQPAESSTCSSSNCVVRAPTRGESVVLAVSKQSLNEMISSGSDRAIAVMVLNGSAFLVSQNTPVSIVDRAFGVRKVLVLEGPMSGRSGWAPAEWVLDRK